MLLFSIEKGYFFYHTKYNHSIPKDSLLLGPIKEPPRRTKLPHPIH